MFITIIYYTLKTLIPVIAPKPEEILKKNMATLHSKKALKARSPGPLLAPSGAQFSFTCVWQPVFLHGVGGPCRAMPWGGAQVLAVHEVFG